MRKTGEIFAFPEDMDRTDLAPAAETQEQRTLSETLAATGIFGLDQILNGGLPRNHLYLIDGSPGTGKTTLALQFLMEGAKKGEGGLYITLSETREELVGVADSHGWDLSGIEIFELASERPAESRNTIQVAGLCGASKLIPAMSSARREFHPSTRPESALHDERRTPIRPCSEAAPDVAIIWITMSRVAT